MFIQKKSAREQLLQNNHKNGSQPKDFNKNTDTPNAYTPQDTIARHRPKVDSVHFEYSFEHINPIYNTHEDTHIINTQEQKMEDYEVEQE